jgi:hypothetical protein
MRASSSISKLIRLCESISDSPSLLQELCEEIESDEKGPLTSMIRGMIQKESLSDLGLMEEVLKDIFGQGHINEIKLVQSSSFGISLFFMPKGTMFPLHDHPNDSVVSGVVYGNLKYLTLNYDKDSKSYLLSSKGFCKQGKSLFCTQNFRNIHSLLAVEDTVLLDIFFGDANGKKEYFLFHVHKKFGRTFYLGAQQFCL